MLVMLATLIAVLVLAPACSGAEAIAEDAGPDPPTVAATMTGIVLLMFLATGGERLAEYFIKPLIALLSAAVNRPDLQAWADYAERLACTIPGAGMVLLLRIDLFAFLGLVMPWPWGMIITAVLAGGGANLVHDFLGAIPDGTTINWAVYEAGNALERARKDSEA